MNKPIISVIIPVYRAMPLLEHCLQSLLSQSIADCMEIICVDDCGGDGSVDFIKKLQSDDKGYSIRLLSMPQNGGASAARNYGLAHAVGDYVAFVDADDYCSLGMFEQLLAAIRRHSADWAFCLAQKEFASGKAELISQPAILSGLFADEERRLMLTSAVACFWTALYSRKFLSENNILFPNGKFSEDSYFWWLVVMLSERVAQVPEVGYHYIIQNNSVSRRPDEQKALLKEDMFLNLIADLRSRGVYTRFAEELDYLFIKKGLLIPLLIQAINLPDTKQVEYKSLIAKALNANIDIRSNRYFKSDVKSRLLYFVFSHFGKIASLVLRLKYKQDPF